MENERDESHEGDEVEDGADAADAEDTRGLSEAALLAGARAAHAREQRQAGVTTAERVRLGQWLAAIKRRGAFRTEGCASLEAWAQQTLGIQVTMTDRYVRIAVLPVSLVAEHDLGVNKLDLLVRCPEPVRARLIPLAPGWPERVLNAAVAAARKIYHKTKDVPEALSAARAAAERAAAKKGTGRKKAPKLDAVAALRTALDLLEAQAEALAKKPEALHQEAQRLQRLFAQVGLGNPVPRGEKIKEDNKIGEIRCAESAASMPPVARPAAVASALPITGAAGPSHDRASPVRPPVLDDALSDAPDDERADELGADPDATVVSLVELMAALREGQTEEQAEEFSKALFGLLANHDPDWEARSRRVIDKVGAIALRAKRFPDELLREWARQMMAPKLEERWQLVFDSYLCAADLPYFADNLDALLVADLPEVYLAQVRDASARHPPDYRPPADPAARAAWRERGIAEITAFMKSLPAQVW